MSLNPECPPLASSLFGTIPIAQSPSQSLFTTCQLEFKAVILLFHHAPCFVSFLIIIRSHHFFSSNVFKQALLCHTTVVPLILISTKLGISLAKRKSVKLRARSVFGTMAGRKLIHRALLYSFLEALEDHHRQETSCSGFPEPDLWRESFSF